MTVPAAGLVSSGFGLSMVTLAAAGSYGPALGVAAAGVIAVLAALAYRPAATLAVALTAVVIALGHGGAIPAAVAGLAAAAYLVIRHTAALTAPTVVAAAGFSFVGMVAVAFPLRVPWLPVLAPLAAFGCYAVVIRPFLGRV